MILLKQTLNSVANNVIKNIGVNSKGSLELKQASNPDIIFIQSDSKLTVSDIKKRPGWNRINAVKNNQIYIIDSDTFSRPGPRTVESMKILSDIIGQNEKNSF